MSHTSDLQISEEGRRYLVENGLNLFAALDCNSLPDNVREMMSGSVRLSDFSRLVVIGNAGRQFWHALQVAGMSSTDPVDSFSRATTQTFCSKFLPHATCDLIYPGSTSIPLQRIGALLGWGHVSPLGIGISNEYGLWFAYRGAFLTSARLPLTEKIAQPFACDSCIDKPCIGRCPASAVCASAAFDIPACVDFRLSENSPCVDCCLARQACPVGASHRYPVEMVRYLYKYSIDSIRRYKSRAPARDQH